MKDSTRQIKYGAMISYVTIAFNIVAGLLYTPWMIRQIGDSDYALYVMATSIIALLMMDFGLGSATSKFIAEYNAKKEYDRANEYIVNSFAIFSAISLTILVVLIVVWFLLNTIYANLTPGELKTFKGLYLIVGSYSILLFPFTPLNSILGGWERFLELKFTVLVQRILNVVFIVIALKGGMGVFALVLVNAVSGIIMTILQLYFVKRIKEIHISWKAVKINVIKQIAGFSLWLLISQICQNLLANLAPAIIGASLSTAEVTLFSLALTLERYVFTFSNGINGLFLPKVSAIMAEAEDKEKRITNLMIKVGKISLTIVGCIIVGFSVMGRGFITLWMGAAYSEIFINALMLMIPLLISSSQQIGYTYLMVGGEIKYQSMTDVITSITGIILLYSLTKVFGVVGATLGLSASMLLNSLIMNVLFVRRLHIDIGLFYKNTYVKWIFCAAVAGIMGNILVHFSEIHQWTDLFIDGALMAAIYGTIIAFSYFSMEERRELFSILKR